MSVFGFSTAPSAGGDFTPIIKYDARAGRVFRVDRAQDAAGNYVTDQVDITGNFKAMIDLENVETGWIDFATGSAPSFVMVPLADLDAGKVKFPERPSSTHKNGIRAMLKLSKECGGDKPIREVAGVAKAFLSGIEVLFQQYKLERDLNAGKLPVVMIERTTPVTTGSGDKKSTNYHPVFKVIGWVPRGDLQPRPASSANGHAQTPNGHAQTPPSTGGTRAIPPQQQPAANLADDFG